MLSLSIVAAMLPPASCRNRRRLTAPIGGAYALASHRLRRGSQRAYNLLRSLSRGRPGRRRRWARPITDRSRIRRPRWEGRPAMKAVTWHGTGDVRVDTVPDPTIEQPTDAVIRVTS